MSANLQPMQTATEEYLPSSSQSSSSLRGKNPRRMKFYEFHDYINQRYFLWTYLYSFFYIIGGGIGYSKTRNIYCIIMGIILGVILLLFSIGHTIDYYRGVQLEALYISGPLVISMFVGVLMTCIYSLGSIFKFSLVIAIVSWISCGFYFYAIVKDYSYGNFNCENRFVAPAYEKLDLAQLLSQRDRQQNSSSTTSNLPTGTGNNTLFNRKKSGQ